MRTIGLLIVALVASSASAAVIEDFEGAWAGAGVLVADPEDAGNTVLSLDGGVAAAFAVTGGGVVTMDIYDFGKTIQDDEGAGAGTSYGPRWGVAGSDGSAAVTIISKSFLNATKGYGMGTETSQTGSWWSPQWFGGPRHVDALQVIGTGTPTEPEVAGDGAWTTWTFTVSPSGLVTITDGVSTQQLSGVGALDEIWVSGGRSGYDLAGVLVDNVAFDVPEPASMSLLVLGGLALVRRRR